MTDILKSALEKDEKKFEIILKHYYDLFSYHASQRLTSFNFFLVSMAFFSNAFALLITRVGEDSKQYFLVAAVLAFTGYLLVIAFGRLDKRNEQIIHINEKPLKILQNSIGSHLSIKSDIPSEWETFFQSEKSYPFRTFGDILPFIYWLFSVACAAGGSYCLYNFVDRKCFWYYCILFMFLTIVSGAAIRCSIFKERVPK